MTEAKRVIWELQEKVEDNECTLLEALSSAFDFGRQASSAPEPAAADRALRAKLNVLICDLNDRPHMTLGSVEFAETLQDVLNAAVASAEPAAVDRAAWAHKALDTWADIEGLPTPSVHRVPGGFAVLETVDEAQSSPTPYATRDAARIAAALALHAASPSRYPAPPAEAAVSTKEPCCGLRESAHPHSPEGCALTHGASVDCSCGPPWHPYKPAASIGEQTDDPFTIVNIEQQERDQERFETGYRAGVEAEQKRQASLMGEGENEP